MFLRFRGEICEIIRFIWVPPSIVCTMTSAWCTFIFRSNYLGWFKCEPLFSATLGLQATPVYVLRLLLVWNNSFGTVVMWRSIWHAVPTLQVILSPAVIVLGSCGECSCMQEINSITTVWDGYSSLEKKETWRVPEWGKKPRYCH